MDLPLFWQFKFVSMANHWMQNLKKPKEFRLQISFVFVFDIFAVQLNLFARSITSKLSFFIVGSFLQFLGVF